MTTVQTTPLCLCCDAGAAYSIRTSRGPLDLSACLSLSSHFPPLGFRLGMSSREELPPLLCAPTPFASIPRRSPKGVVGPSASSSRRWNYNSAGAGLVHAFDSRRAVCELFASHNTQILACFPDQLG